MRLPHVEERVKEPRDVAAEQERGDARLVGLEAESDDVAHQPHVCANIFGQTVVRPLHRDGRLAPVARACVCLLFRGSHGRGPFLDLADAGEILVELGPVAYAHPPAQVRGLLAHAVEDALVALAAAVVKKAVERQRRIDFHRHRRGRALPGNMRAVGHREVGLVVAGDRLLAAQHHAGLDRLLAQVPGELLVDTDAPFQLGPLLKRGPREDVARLARVDSHARGVLVEQAGNDIDLGLQAATRARGKGRAPSCRRHPWPTSSSWLTPQPMNKAANRFGQGAGRSPAIAAAPQTGTDSSHGRAIVTPTPLRNVRRDACCPPAESFSCLVHAHGLHSSALATSTRLFRNCGLVTMLSTRLPKRSPSAASRVRMPAMVSSSEGKRLRPSA